MKKMAILLITLFAIAGMLYILLSQQKSSGPFINCSPSLGGFGEANDITTLVCMNNTYVNRLNECSGDFTGIWDCGDIYIENAQTKDQIAKKIEKYKK